MKNFQEPIIVISAGHVLDDLKWQNERALSDWRDECAGIRASYKQKTSRGVKGETEYVYTKWYKINPDGSLKSVGDKEPDWKKLFPPEPVPVQMPGVTYNSHLLVDKKDYEANSRLFKECLAFRLEDCVNFIHPLYKNPDKALKGDSVRGGGGAAGRSQTSGGTEKEDHCWLDGDCDNCEHADECPVVAEADSEIED